MIKDKSNIKFKKLTLTHIYEFYKDQGGKLDLKTYRNICNLFNERVMDRMIYHGELFKLGYGLSRVGVIAVKRNFKKLTIDWIKSNKRKAKLIAEGKTPYSKENPDGVEWFVYDNSDFFYSFWWDKQHCKVKNQIFYIFSATRGLKGNTQKLKRFIDNHLTPNQVYINLELIHGKYTYLGSNYNRKDLQRSKH